MSVRVNGVHRNDMVRSCTLRRELHVCRLIGVVCAPRPPSPGYCLDCDVVTCGRQRPLRGETHCRPGIRERTFMSRMPDKDTLYTIALVAAAIAAIVFTLLVLNGMFKIVAARDLVEREFGPHVRRL